MCVNEFFWQGLPIDAVKKVDFGLFWQVSSHWIQKDTVRDELVIFKNDLDMADVFLVKFVARLVLSLQKLPLIVNHLLALLLDPWLVVYF